MRLSQLKFLVELKKYGTISKTAQQLYVSQPSLSTAIRELEEELGFPILERSNKGVAFTKKGEQVLKYSQDAMRAVQSIEQLGHMQGRTRQGYLSIGSVYYVFQNLVMDAFLELKKRYPDMSVSLQEENSYRMIDLVTSGKIDIGIVMISNIEELAFQQLFDRAELEFYKILDDEMHFVVGCNHPLAERESATMEEMLQYPFLTRRNMLNDYNEHMLQQYNANLEIIKIDHSDSLLKYLSESQAVTIMPRCAFWKNTYTLDKQLRAIRISDYVWTTKVGWIFPRDQHYSLELEEFVELMEKDYFIMQQEM